MVCSHCKSAGHTYIKCPNLTQEQIKAIKEERNKKKAEVAERRRIREELRKKKAEEAEKSKLRTYSLYNDNDYEVVLYWGSSSCETGILKRFHYVAPYTASSCTASRLHRIVVFPLLEVIGGNSFDAKKVIKLKHGDDTNDIIRVIDVNLIDYPDSHLNLKLKYEKKKTEVEQWKEFGLKSHFLLKQIENLTSCGKDKEGNLKFHEKYENIIPFLEMTIDIKVPESCSDVDKERAGIPSKLTNIT